MKKFFGKWYLLLFIFTMGVGCVTFSILLRSDFFLTYEYLPLLLYLEYLPPVLVSDVYELEHLVPELAGTRKSFVRIVKIKHVISIMSRTWLEHVILKKGCNSLRITTTDQDHNIMWKIIKNKSIGYLNWYFSRKSRCFWPARPLLTCR